MILQVNQISTRQSSNLFNEIKIFTFECLRYFFQIHLKGPFTVHLKIVQYFIFCQYLKWSWISNVIFLLEEKITKSILNWTLHCGGGEAVSILRKRQPGKLIVHRKIWMNFFFSYIYLQGFTGATMELLLLKLLYLAQKLSCIYSVNKTINN